MRSARPPLDLLATLGLSLLALLIALIPAAPWLRAAVLIPFVLLLPGYALACALLAPRTVPAAERLVYTASLSIAAAVLSAVIVQLLLGLDRTVWAILLTLVTVGASVVALRRRRALPAGRPRQALTPVLAPASIGALLAAVGLAAWAISIASAGARKDRAEARFTGLWVLPAKRAPAAGAAVSIGVQNHEGAPVSYVVRTTQRGRVLAEQSVRLRAGARWRARVPVAAISSAAAVQVTLLRAGTVYRTVYLDSGQRP